MKIGIDLLWVKHKKSGGIESYIRNLLDGFLKYSDDNYEFMLFVSKDNYFTFENYFFNSKFKRVLCNIKSNKQMIRIIWENIHLNKLGEKYDIDVMFVPVYSKPIFKTHNFPYVIVIHDLQAIHYPQYFSKLKYTWLKFAWERSIDTASKIITISNFVKNDIIKNYKTEDDKIQVIYNPITKSSKMIDFKTLSKKYNLESKKYFYTVSSMEPHKNLNTLLHVIKDIRDKKLNLPKKLVISGVGGKNENQFKQLVEKLGIAENIVITKFVSNEERDCLYKNAFCFLFPSLFEGFGMPPIEALINGTPVITTNLSSIPEVTNNKAIYVKNPFDIDEWILKISYAKNQNLHDIEFSDYNLECVSKQYLKQFDIACKNIDIRSCKIEK